MKQNAIPTKARKVRKAVIPAAGLGTRFLPATKAIAKEMLPIVDKPTIQFIVEEALKSGIEDILIVTGKAKRPIEDHLTQTLSLNKICLKKEKQNYLNLLKKRQILIFTLSVNLIQKDWDMPFFKLKLLLEMSLL